MFSVTLGCLHQTGHIDIDAGIFAPLEEKLIHLQREQPIPAHHNTSCKCRRTSQCNVDCPKAVTGFRSYGKISYQNKGARL